MNRVDLRYQPAEMEIRRDDLVAALGNVRRYVEARRDLWYSIINERLITPAWIEEALATLKF